MKGKENGSRDDGLEKIGIELFNRDSISLAENPQHRTLRSTEVDAVIIPLMSMIHLPDAARKMLAL